MFSANLCPSKMRLDQQLDCVSSWQLRYIVRAIVTMNYVEAINYAFLNLLVSISQNGQTNELFECV